MWKLIVAFVLFAAAALYMLSKGGDVSMGGETHSGDFHAAPGASDAAHGAAPAASAAVEAASAAVAPAASAASN